ncbi:MAG: hypothetical protein J5659_04540 [Clostridia bacterium]|nr:hypothetical protein [Clostridia bacterium]
MEKEKYWLKFVLSGKPEDYIKYSSLKTQEENGVKNYSFYDGRVGDRPEQHRG